MTLTELLRFVLSFGVGYVVLVVLLCIAGFLIAHSITTGGLWAKHTFNRHHQPKTNHEEESQG